MALQVWLHGKDLINQGLCPNNATWVGPATYADGKLGKCYSCTGSHYISYVYDFAGTNKFTIAFWIYIPTSLSTCNQWEEVFRLQDYLIDWADYNNLKIYDNSINQLWWLSGHIFYDKWVHLAIAHNADTITLYINGDHYATVASTSSPISSGTMYAGRGITDEHGPVKFNDIRIYDHCLSPKEVKEIAKGLVLHYPLNDAYVEGTTNLVTSITKGGQTTVNGYEVTTSGVSKDTYFTLNLSEKIVAGNTYTISCRNNFDTGLYWDFTIRAQANQTLTWRITSGYSSYTFVANSSNSYWDKNTCFMDDLSGTARNAGKSFKMWDWQIEKKDHATPFVIGTRNETTVYDCSGYQNNGTISGSLSCNADSPRYKISTHFTSSIPSRIMLPSDMSCLSGNNEQTLSCWVKSSGLGSGMSFSGLISLGYGNTLSLDAWNYCYRIDNGSNLDALYSNQNPHDGKWHLVTATYKSGVASIYVDGVLKNSISRTFSNRYINNGLNCIGTETNNVNTNNINGDISDVRMYTTALSAEDIKELYNTSAYVSDNGTLLTYSVEE